MTRSLISFGANLGDPLATIQDAARELGKRLHCTQHDLQLSRFYRTPPVGGPSGQPPFVNAVASITTDQSEWEVWDALRQVEKQFGRSRNQRWEARKIDLDLLLCQDPSGTAVCVWTPQLKIPHPRMCMRRFILVPAADVAGDWIEPNSGRCVSDLAARLMERSSSLLYVTERAVEGAMILAEAARAAMAEVRTLRGSTSEFGGRWVANCRAIDLDESTQLTDASRTAMEAKRLAAEANLVVYESVESKAEGVAWEDANRQLIRQMGLLSCTPPHLARTPRYLLNQDDNHWAIHELIAALDAMDCPVEVIAG